MATRVWYDISGQESEGPMLLRVKTFDERPASMFLQLPFELKLDIVDQLDRKRDLYNLSLTSHACADLALTRLYRDVDVEIPQSRLQRWNVGGLPAFRPEAIQSMRSLAMHSGTLDLRDHAYDRNERFEAVSVDDYVSRTLSRIPKQQLTSFAFMHATPLSLQTLDVLASNHGQSLRKLATYELEGSRRLESAAPTHLTSLAFRSIGDGTTVAKLVHSNSKTLESLELGQERQLFEQYRRSRIGFLEQINQSLDVLGPSMRIQSMPKLHKLALYGLDATSLVPSSIPDALFFYQLESLTLESCSGSAGFLGSLAGTFRYSQTSPQVVVKTVPKLKHFFFRHENPTTPLKDALINFLSSFTGLQTLSLLVENATFVERPSALINTHGPTLQTLVLESRIQPREHLGLDTSRPFGIGGYSQQLWEDTISDICASCPALHELGIGFPWDDEMVLVRQTGSLSSLRALRTMHVRNFPESSVLSQIGDYSIKEYAQKYLEWVYPALVGEPKPALETLSIGPTVYETRWKTGAAPNRRSPPEFLRTHHFWVDWAKTRFGRWSALVTPVSERYLEEVRGEKPLDGMFRQVWLM